MLKGGDSVPIVPVQGGGSMMGNTPPPSYNPNETMLNGGDSVPIIAVRGGANDNTNRSSNETNETNTLSTVGLSNNNDETNTLSSVGLSNARSTDGISNDETNEFNNNGTTITNLTNNNENNFSSVGAPNNVSDDGTENYENNESQISNNNEETEEGKEEEEEEEEKKPKTGPCEPPEDTEELNDLEDKFVSPEEAHTEKGKTIIIKVKAMEYTLRLPERDIAIPPAKYEDPIYTNWKEVIFTEEETEFLNSLELSPKLLYMTFHCLDREWRHELAEFLYFLTVDVCWPERTTLTHAKCQKVREFLALVGAQICVEKLRKLEKEKGEPIIPEGVVLGDVNTSVDEKEEGKEEEETISDTNNEGDDKTLKEAEEEEDDESVLNSIEENVKSLKDGDDTNTDSVISNIDNQVPKDKKTPGFFEKVKAKFNLSGAEGWFGALASVFMKKKENKDVNTILKNVKQNVPEEKRTPSFLEKIKDKFDLTGTEGWFGALASIFQKKKPVEETVEEPSNTKNKDHDGDDINDDSILDLLSEDIQSLKNIEEEDFGNENEDSGEQRKYKKPGSYLIKKKFRTKSNQKNEKANEGMADETISEANEKANEKANANQVVGVVNEKAKANQTLSTANKKAKANQTISIANEKSNTNQVVGVVNEKAKANQTVATANEKSNTNQVVGLVNEKGKDNQVTVTANETPKNNQTITKPKTNVTKINKTKVPRKNNAGTLNKKPRKPGSYLIKKTFGPTRPTLRKGGGKSRRKTKKNLRKSR